MGEMVVVAAKCTDGELVWRSHACVGHAHGDAMLTGGIGGVVSEICISIGDADLSLGHSKHLRS